MPVISVWNKCNNKCIMCTNGTEYEQTPVSRYSLKEQISKMERYLKGEQNMYFKGAGDGNYLAFTGGEPTLHPDFIKLIYYFRKRFPGKEATLLTNGRTFSNEEFLKKYLAAAGYPSRTIMPIHSNDPEEHDYIAGVRGAFEQTIRGLRNLFKYAPDGHSIGIRYIQHGVGNRTRMARTLRFLLENFPDTERYSLAIIHYEIEGHSFSNEKDIHISLTDSAAEALAAKPLIDQFKCVYLYHYPLCVLDESLRPLARITLPDEDRFFPEEVCGKCVLREKCLGLMIDYAKLFGYGELKAVR